MFDISYNGKTGRYFGVAVVERPKVPTPLKHSEAVSVAGRDGQMFIYDGTYDDIAIAVDFNFVSAPHDWMGRFRAVKNWLLAGNGGQLVLSDDAGVYYKVKSVEISDAERAVKRIGRFTATFTCDPYAYLTDGLVEYTGAAIKTLKYNPYTISHPIYKITGSGTKTLKVGANTQVKVVVSDSVTIDTDKMITYRSDGTLINTAITGDYSDLYLPHGDFALTYTDSNFAGLTVIPNWRTL